MTIEERLFHEVRRHQAGLLLDTNVLLVHLADAVDPSFARSWERTSDFQPEYVALLRIATSAAHRYVTTPHILTEAANLAAGGKERDSARRRLRQKLREYALTAVERIRPSRELAKDAAFDRLGIADVAQLLLPIRRRPLVVTDDGPLTVELERRRSPVTNLYHLLYSTA